jgi:ribosomal protein S18 acetylase RimI-like enzyme
LMALERPLEAPPVDARVRRLEPGDAALPAARAVADIAFAALGAVAGDGPRERDAALGHYPEARLGVVRERLRTGLTVTVVAEDDDGVLAVGSHQPVGGVTEIVGVGTLPAARRRGLGAAVTAALVADARSGGAGVVFLSAGSDDIARMYRRLGFTRVATAGIALPAVSS